MVSILHPILTKLHQSKNVWSNLVVFELINRFKCTGTSQKLINPSTTKPSKEATNITAKPNKASKEVKKGFDGRMKFTGIFNIFIMINSE